ncbi:MAG: DegT/DnrJ/EryC1/StrS family aminotransferase [Magnetococcus sp. WYHC-3]
MAEAFACNYIAPVGPQLDAFEQAFAAKTGLPHALAVNSGTAAMLLAFRALGVGPGDTVFCSTLTFVASIAPAVQLGATPVFIDSNNSSWCLDPELLARALADAAAQSRLPKVVVAVDLYGQSCDMDRILAICRPYGVPVIEDAAEALGATYHGVPAGQRGDLAVYSFNGNKIITTSAGGMLAGRDRRLIEKCRFWATQARDPAPHYEHTELGYNCRMSNILAAIGCAQLDVLEARVAAKRAIFDRYAAQLGDLSGVSFMPEAPYGRCSRWLTVLLLNEASGTNPENVRLALERENIEARLLWKPMHLQPVFGGVTFVEQLDGPTVRRFNRPTTRLSDRPTVQPSHSLSVSETLFRCGLCLPSGTAMTEADQARVIRVVRQCLGVRAGKQKT